MTKHTPGPWTTTIRDGHAKGPRPVITAPAVDRVAVVSGSNGDDAMHANAKLIAAAPELLDALDSLVLACELPGDHCEVEQALPAARAAISKAVGGLP